MTDGMMIREIMKDPLLSKYRLKKITIFVKITRLNYLAVISNCLGLVKRYLYERQSTNRQITFLQNRNFEQNVCYTDVFIEKIFAALTMSHNW